MERKDILLMRNCSNSGVVVQDELFLKMFNFSHTKKCVFPKKTKDLDKI